jgi:hypothetical protein
MIYWGSRKLFGDRPVPKLQVRGAKESCRSCELIARCLSVLRHLKLVMRSDLISAATSISWCLKQEIQESGERGRQESSIMMEGEGCISVCNAPAEG